MSYKNHIIVFSAIFFATVATYFLVNPHLSIRDNKLIEILKMSDIYGNKISGPENKKYVILNFWATWCPPCVEETPSLIRFAEKHKNDFYLLALSQDDSKKDIFTFINTFPSIKSNFITIIHDNSQAMARAYKVNKLPETFIYSIKDNKIMQFSGSTDWDKPQVLDLIQETFK